MNEPLIFAKEINSIKVIKEKLEHLYLDEFCIALSNNSKLDIYNSIKKKYNFENYLTEIKNPKHRLAVTKLRTSAHTLPIEIGRYTRTPRSERKCKLCNIEEIGDEFHYLMKCTNPSIIELRERFMDSLFTLNSNFQSLNTESLFKYIINMSDSLIMRVSASYVYEIFSLYNSFEVQR